MNDNVGIRIQWEEDEEERMLKLAMEESMKEAKAAGIDVNSVHITPQKSSDDPSTED